MSIQDKISALEADLARKESEYLRAVFRRDYGAANRLSWQKRSIFDQISELTRS